MTIFRASSYKPGNRAGSVSRTKFAFCSCGKFQLVTEINKARPFKFHPGYPAGVFIWEDLGRKSQDLGIRTNTPSHMNTSLSSAEASFTLPCVLLGRVGNLEAGERVNESARGTLVKAHLLFPLPPSPPPRSLCGGESEHIELFAKESVVK